NAADVDGPALSATGLAISTGAGSLVDNGNGTWTYTPAADDDTAVSFSYTITDGSASVAGSATLDITPVDDLPVANNDVYATNEDTPLVIGAGAGVLANDSGLGDGPINVTIAGAPAGGTVVVNSDGSFTFNPTADFNGVASFTYQIADADGDVATATVSITVNAVNDLPALGNNDFTITDGGTVVVLSGNLSASDVDDTAGSLVFDAGGVTHGRFELVSKPGVPITSFTQAQILAGQVQFVHDGSGQAPAFQILVSDAAGTVGPYTASIIFRGGGAGSVSTPPPAAGNGGGTATPVAPPAPPLATQIQPASAGSRPAEAAFRAPTNPPADGGEDGQQLEVAAPVAVAAPGAAQVQKAVTLEAVTPTVRAETEATESKPLTSEVEVATLRAEMQVLPMRRDSLENPDDEERKTIEVIMGTVRVTGLAFSVGAVWWAARAAGLVASLLASSPAWRHVDPLPVLGRDDEEEEQWGEADDEENKDHKDDEHRAAWVLEEREGSS
ncbi:MAG TPA: tandem-95 repeat protein, partial [Burkholderiales bacterium]|nr:tandem-95 repeat protein [Burkholderiales bacterium]